MKYRIRQTAIFTSLCLMVAAMSPTFSVAYAGPPHWHYHGPAKPLPGPRGHWGIGFLPVIPMH